MDLESIWKSEGDGARPSTESSPLDAASRRRLQNRLNQRASREWRLPPQPRSSNQMLTSDIKEKEKPYKLRSREEVKNGAGLFTLKKQRSPQRTKSQLSRIQQTWTNHSRSTNMAVLATVVPIKTYMPNTTRNFKRWSLKEPPTRSNRLNFSYQWPSSISCARSLKTLEVWVWHWIFSERISLRSSILLGLFLYACHQAWSRAKRRKASSTIPGLTWSQSHRCAMRFYYRRRIMTKNNYAVTFTEYVALRQKSGF
jgi:hypothetical protein